jgi:hypothetical protein
MSITARLDASPNFAESAGKWPNPRHGWRIAARGSPRVTRSISRATSSRLPSSTKTISHERPAPRHHGHPHGQVGEALLFLQEGTTTLISRVGSGNPMCAVIIPPLWRRDCTGPLMLENRL